MKTGLVLEGGGMRGIYTVGVLDCLMEHQVQVDYIIGVSAGACNGVSFVSGQRGRTLRIDELFLEDKRYISMDNYYKTRSLFGMDFIFDEIPNQLDLFDYEAFFASPIEYVVGVTDVETGKPAFFGKDAMEPKNTLLRASSSIPGFAPMVEFQGAKYLDGGTTAPIPVERALEDGCEKLIIVLTRERSYQKQPEHMRPLYHRHYEEYPELVRAIAQRHLVYNRTLDQIRRLERSGRAVVIAPEKALGISRFEKKMKTLRPCYYEGILDAQKKLRAIEALLRQEK